MGLTGKKVNAFQAAGLVISRSAFPASEPQRDKHMLAGSRNGQFDAESGNGPCVKRRIPDGVELLSRKPANNDEIEKINRNFCLRWKLNFVDWLLSVLTDGTPEPGLGLLPTRRNWTMLSRNAALPPQLRCEIIRANWILAAPDYYEERPKGVMNGLGQLSS